MSHLEILLPEINQTLPYDPCEKAHNPTDRLVTKKCKTQESFIQSGEGGEPTRCPWTAAFAVGAVALGSPAPCRAPVSPAAPRESLSSTTPDERQSESKEDHENHDTAAPVHVLDGENKDA